MTDPTVRTAPLRILVADDEPLILRGIQRVLETRGHDVILAHDGHEAQALVAERAFDAVLLDVGMPGGGLGVAQALVDDISFDGPIVLMTGDLAADTAEQMGPAVQRLQKPFAFPAVIPLLEGAGRT